MTGAKTERDKITDLQLYLKIQCNRLSLGHCSTLACLKRGGYVRSSTPQPVVYALSTCEEYEIYVRLQELKDKVYET